MKGLFFFSLFLVADFVRPSVRRSVRNSRVEKWKNECFRCFFGYVCWWGAGHGEWMGVGCPCPPIRNNIVTPRHLFSSTVASKIANETDSNFSFFSIPTGRNISDPRLFLWTGIFYGLILFLPFTLIFVGESSHATAIYTNIVLSTDCVGREKQQVFLYRVFNLI